MNKKVNEKFKGIRNVYLLQCICTELLDENEKLKDNKNKANEILNKGCFEYDNCPDSVINEIIELKEIIGDKENE